MSPSIETNKLIRKSVDCFLYDGKIDKRSRLRFLTRLLSKLFCTFRYGALTFGDVQNIVPETVEQNKYNAVKKLFARHTARVGVIVIIILFSVSLNGNFFLMESYVTVAKANCR